MLLEVYGFLGNEGFLRNEGFPGIEGLSWGSKVFWESKVRRVDSAEGAKTIRAII